MVSVDVVVQGLAVGQVGSGLLDDQGFGLDVGGAAALGLPQHLEGQGAEGGADEDDEEDDGP